MSDFIYDRESRPIKDRAWVIYIQNRKRLFLTILIIVIIILAGYGTISAFNALYGYDEYAVARAMADQDENVLRKKQELTDVYKAAGIELSEEDFIIYKTGEKSEDGKYDKYDINVSTDRKDELDEKKNEIYRNLIGDGVLDSIIPNITNPDGTVNPNGTSQNGYGFDGDGGWSSENPNGGDGSNNSSGSGGNNVWNNGEGVNGNGSNSGGTNFGGNDVIDGDQGSGGSGNSNWNNSDNDPNSPNNGGSNNGGNGSNSGNNGSNDNNWSNGDNGVGGNNGSNNGNNNGSGNSSWSGNGGSGNNGSSNGNSDNYDQFSGGGSGNNGGTGTMTAQDAEKYVVRYINNQCNLLNEFVDRSLGLLNNEEEVKYTKDTFNNELSYLRTGNPKGSDRFGGLPGWSYEQATLVYCGYMFTHVIMMQDTSPLVYDNLYNFEGNELLNCLKNEYYKLNYDSIDLIKEDHSRTYNWHGISIESHYAIYSNGRVLYTMPDFTLLDIE